MVRLPNEKLLLPSFKSLHSKSLSLTSEIDGAFNSLLWIIEMLLHHVNPCIFLMSSSDQSTSPVFTILFHQYLL
jgi:hypothetical protein